MREHGEDVMKRRHKLLRVKRIIDGVLHRDTSQNPKDECRYIRRPQIPSVPIVPDKSNSTADNDDEEEKVIVYENTKPYTPAMRKRDTKSYWKLLSDWENSKPSKQK